MFLLSPRSMAWFATSLVGATLFACGAETTTEAPVPKEEPAAPASPASPVAPPTTAPSSTPTVDASVPDVATPKVPTTALECFEDLIGQIPGPDYDKFAPVIGKNCAGTKHQNITGVEKVVFLGDSVTKGTPPTLPQDYYTSKVLAHVKQRFGANVEVADCSKWGARNDDFIGGGDQIAQCFPSGVEEKKTLIVMTMGGNDIAAWMKDKLDEQAAIDAALESAALLSDALHWLKDPAHFPNGSYVLFANVYEYTDTSGDLLSCPQALIGGVSGNWSQGASGVVRFQEEYMRLAVETQTDMIFLLETFCGHGYRRHDPNLQCYRGPNAPLYFDLTCTHPNPVGHGVIARLFNDIIDNHLPSSAP